MILDPWIKEIVEECLLTSKPISDLADNATWPAPCELPKIYEEVQKWYPEAQLMKIKERYQRHKKYFLWEPQIGVVGWWDRDVC